MAEMGVFSWSSNTISIKVECLILKEKRLLISFYFMSGPLFHGCIIFIALICEQSLVVDFIKPAVGLQTSFITVIYLLKSY